MIALGSSPQTAGLTQPLSSNIYWTSQADSFLHFPLPPFLLSLFDQKSKTVTIESPHRTTMSDKGYTYKSSGYNNEVYPAR